LLSTLEKLVATNTVPGEPATGIVVGVSAHDGRDSAPLRLALRGKLPKSEPVLAPFALPRALTTSLALRSAVDAVRGADVLANIDESYTRANANGVASEDFVLYSYRSMRALAALGPLPMERVRMSTALPSPAYPSDHLLQLTVFEHADSSSSSTAGKKRKKAASK